MELANKFLSFSLLICAKIWRFCMAVLVISSLANQTTEFLHEASLVTHHFDIAQFPCFSFSCACRSFPHNNFLFEVFRTLPISQIFLLKMLYGCVCVCVCVMCVCLYVCVYGNKRYLKIRCFYTLMARLKP